MKEAEHHPSAFAGRLFRWRSYPPVVAILGLALGLGLGYGSREAAAWMVPTGLALALLGLALRSYAVGFAPVGASGRHLSQYAERLSTSGIYSVLRHPLYLGNVMVWIGASATSAWLPGTAVSAALGIAVFTAISRHEDSFLARRFGSDYHAWAGRTPAFWPRLSQWRPPAFGFSPVKAILSEYSTLHTIGLVCLLYSALRHWNATQALPPRGWWIALAANSGLYVGIRIWRQVRKDRQRP